MKCAKLGMLSGTSSSDHGLNDRSLKLYDSKAERGILSVSDNTRK